MYSLALGNDVTPSVAGCTSSTEDSKAAYSLEIVCLVGPARMHSSSKGMGDVCNSEAGESDQRKWESIVIL